jgi:nitrate reductase beta subunit
MLFGPGVRQAIETYRRAMNGDDPELLGALLLAVSTDRIITKFEVDDDVVVGWAEGGEEVVRVPITVPTIERAAFDPELEVYRYNIT